MIVRSQAHTVVIEDGESSRVGQSEDGAIESADAMDTSKMSNNTRGNIQESNKTELKLSRENSKKVKKLKHAYIKFYREIIDLQNYRWRISFGVGLRLFESYYLSVIDGS